MNKFIALLALIATFAEAQKGKCTKVSCSEPVPDKVESGEWCECLCLASVYGCPFGMQPMTEQCGCEPIRGPQGTCSKLICDEQFPDKEGSGKDCECKCLASVNGCPAGQQPLQWTCGCEEIPAFCDKTCEDKWVLDDKFSPQCKCIPAIGQDPCHERYGGQFTQADGTVCPPPHPCDSSCRNEDYCCAEWAIAKMPVNPVWGAFEEYLVGWGGPYNMTVGDTFNICTESNFVYAHRLNTASKQCKAETSYEFMEHLWSRMDDRWKSELSGVEESQVANATMSDVFEYQYTNERTHRDFHLMINCVDEKTNMTRADAPSIEETILCLDPVDSGANALFTYFAALTVAALVFS